jgi:hypothetical protein
VICDCDVTETTSTIEEKRMKGAGEMKVKRLGREEYTTSHREFP